MKKIIFAILIIICFSLLGCSYSYKNSNTNSSDPVTPTEPGTEPGTIEPGTEPETTEPSTEPGTIETKSQDNTSEISSKESAFVMKIDNIDVDITWENNESVKELMEYAKNGITITMHQYGGFEQVGPIGKTITSSDSQMTTNPGDVVLYSSNQIVIFFGTNSWSYTKLGHINLNQSELGNLLNKNNVTLTLMG